MKTGIRVAAVFVVLTGIWKTAMFWGLFAFSALPYRIWPCNPDIYTGSAPRGFGSSWSQNVYQSQSLFLPGAVCVSKSFSDGGTPYLHTVHPEYSGLFVVAAVIVAAFATWMFTRFRREPARAIAVFVAGFIAQIGAMVALTVWDAARIAQEYGADCVTWVLPPSAFGQFPASELVVISSGCSANAFYKGILMISLDPTPAAIIAGVALAIAVVLAWKGTHRIVEGNTYAA